MSYIGRYSFHVDVGPRDGNILHMLLHRDHFVMIGCTCEMVPSNTVCLT